MYFFTFYFAFRHIKAITDELGKERVDYIKAVAELYCNLNDFQVEYVMNKIKERKSKIETISPIDLNVDWPSVSELGDVPPVNPEFFKQQELMSEFTKWLKTQEGVNLGFGAISSGGAAPAVSAGDRKLEAQVEKKPEKKEKMVYDLYLLSFDAAKKIVLIKELRAITNLGLKESKELTEKLPSLVCKNIKPDEAKPVIEKIEAAGGKVELK